MALPESAQNIGTSLDELIAQFGKQEQPTPTPSIQDLFTKGNVTSSQPIPAAGMGDTQYLPTKSSGSGSRYMDILGGQGPEGVPTGVGPETYRDIARNTLGNILTSPSGTPEQRAGIQSELGRMTAEDTEKRREAMEMGRPGREQAARVAAEQSLSPTRMTEEAAKISGTTSAGKELIAAQTKGDIQKMAYQPLSPSPLMAGLTFGSIAKDPASLVERLKLVTGLQSLSTAGQLFQGLAMAGNMGAFGTDEVSKQNAMMAFFAAWNVLNNPGTNLSDYIDIQRSKSGGLMWIPKGTAGFGNVMPSGEMPSPGVRPGFEMLAP